MTRLYRFTVLSFLMAVSLMVSSTSATCADGPAFIDGTCMTDIYAFVTVKIPFNNSTSFLVDLTDVTASIPGGSWGFGTNTPTFMIAPGKMKIFVLRFGDLSCVCVFIFVQLSIEKT